MTISFPSPDQVTIHFDDVPLTAPFRLPLEKQEQRELAWYFETYAGGFVSQVDIQRAQTLEKSLENLGQRLYNDCIGSHGRNGEKLFQQWINSNDHPLPVLEIIAEHTAILELPWELLRPPGTPWLCTREPPISVVRGSTVDSHNQSKSKAPSFDLTDHLGSLRVLMVVSRPQDAGFVNPQADSLAVLEATERLPADQVHVEFLRPPTLNALKERFQNGPPVDLLHFDGHGAHDKKKGGLLLFETDQRQADPVPAQDVADAIAHQPPAIAVISACRSAAAEAENPYATSAQTLLRGGVASVLASPYNMLVQTGRHFYTAFYAMLTHGAAPEQALNTARSVLLDNSERGWIIRDNALKPLQLSDWWMPTLYQRSDLLHQRVPDSFSILNEKRLDLVFNPQDGPELIGLEEMLWRLERAFADGAGCILLHGLRGAGKSVLATEAGRWLLRIGLFSRTITLDLADPELTIPDGAQPGMGGTLLVLDSSNQDQVTRDLAGCLEPWLTQGGAVLACTRHPGHTPWNDIAKQSWSRFLAMNVGGLSNSSAYRLFLERCRKDSDSPPPDYALFRRWMRTIHGHPQTLLFLATTKMIDVSDQPPERIMDTMLERQRQDPEVLEVEQALDRVDEDFRRRAAGLGVLCGGGMVELILHLFQIGDKEDKTAWYNALANMQRSGLATLVPLLTLEGRLLRFHPMLAPLLLETLDNEQRTKMQHEYINMYYTYSNECFELASTPASNVARGMVVEELPNLMQALRLGIADPEFPDRSGFYQNISLFLRLFSLSQELDEISELAEILDKENSNSFMGRLARAQHYNLVGQHAEAEALYREVMSRPDQIPPLDLTLIYRELGHAIQQQARPEEAIELFEEAEKLIREHSSSEIKDWKHLRLSTSLDRCAALTKAGRIDEAESTLSELERDYYDALTSSPYYAQYAIAKIFIHLKNRELQQAETLCHQASEILTSSAERTNLSRLFLNLSIIQAQGESWSDADKSLQKAAELAEETQDANLAASIWVTQGAQHFIQDNLTQGMAYFAQAEEKLGNLEPDADWIRMYIIAGDTLTDHKHYQEAEPYYLSALDISRKCTNSSLEP
ncbi:MAG: CHAT domain-containing protein, partial [Magnetococcales bacterium]|nr:CHAT domain-containing protein [Magnetococcales bacterium]